MFNSSKLLPYQVAGSEAIYNCILSNRDRAVKHGCILIAPTRSGKTYTVINALVNAQQAGAFELPFNEGDLRLAKVLIVSKKTIEIQTGRVAMEFGLKDFMVTSYSSIRSSFGEHFIDWRKELEYGSMVEKPHWREEDKPSIIWCDECQELKNDNAQAALIIQAAIEQGILVIFSSATPFVTVAEAKLVCMGTGLSNHDNWKTFSNSFCIDKRPDEICPANMKRLMDYMDGERGVVVRFKNIKFKHRVFNKCKLIDFRSKEARDRYLQAYEEYLEVIRKVGRNGPEGVAAIWVAMLKFRQASELERSQDLAEMAAAIIKTDNRQIIIGSNFVATLRSVWKHLVKTYGIIPEQISHIVGNQTQTERQEHVDRFQRGIAEVCLLTLKAGGVGLSLHHERPEARPRHVILPPTWSGIELVQVLGRGHGPTSLSTTYQDVVWYRDTIEEQVAAKVATRFSCLSEVVGRKENWVSLFNQVSSKDAEGVEQELENKVIEESTEKDAETGEEIQFSVEALENFSEE